MEEFESLKQLIVEIEEDIRKAEGGNKAAGTRVRLQVMSHMAIALTLEELQMPTQVLQSFARALTAHFRQRGQIRSGRMAILNQFHYGLVSR